MYLIFENYLFAIYTNYILKINNFNYLYININKNKILVFIILLHIHYNTQLKSFVDLTIVDFLEKKNRFLCIYNLVSIIYNYRYLLKIWIDNTYTIFSLINLYPTVCWYEREAWDLFGIKFINNYDLRRILNDYGFIGFPLRKDFPLCGYIELKYDYLLKNIKYVPIKLIQEYRFFNVLTPWNFFN